MIHSLEVTKVSKRFGRTRALKDINLRFDRGSISLLLGANGAGKSTLLGLMSTLVRPTSGEILYRTNNDESTIASSTLRKHIGVLAHESFVYGGLSGEENLVFYGNLYGVREPENRAKELLRTVALPEKAWDRPASTYSRGMLQRLSLARVLIHDPAVLLLDEPFTGLDRGGCQRLASVIMQCKADNRMVICVTHDFGSVSEVANRVVVLKRGKVAADESKTGEKIFLENEIHEIYRKNSTEGEK